MTNFYWSVITTDGLGRVRTTRPVALATESTQFDGTATGLAEVMLRREVARAESGSTTGAVRIEVRVWEGDPATSDQPTFENAVWQEDQGNPDVLE